MSGQTQSQTQREIARLPLGYRRPAGPRAARYDEFLEPGGGIRPHWRELGAWFDKIGPRDIESRWNQARRILRDNGVAYNAGAPDGQGPARAWELNPVPLRIPESEWQGIASAVRQRARLLNGVLEDLYGPQELLRAGLIPPALVLGNSNYLRPCAGVPVPRGARLVFYAADLARSPDGAWWVLSDRTQAPSGAGYALENRVVLSRVFPEMFQSLRVARLGGFFQRMKEALEALSPRPGQPPTVVLLTPGRLNETYFEQAYLARQLDFTLVEGQDLTVRNDTVFIRTLGGLQRVDVILRRVDDDYCDPLELRDESLLGVPGLLGAVRAGTVVLANSLGSGVVQCPALGAFLPRLCERLLGERLLMPSVATWWCGQSAERRYVLENLPRLVVHPAFDFPGRPNEEGLPEEALREAIESQPELHTAQEFVRLSQCPDFNGGALDPRSVVLRVFAVREGDSYAVMPGGLTRVAEEESSRGALVLRGGGTKDTWVDAPEESAESTTPRRSTGGRRTVPGLTSRIADSLFWLGRYAERAEFSARLARSMLEGLSNHADWMELEDVAPMVGTFRYFGQLQLPEPLQRASLERALVTQLAERQRPGSLVSLVARLREIMISVRDQVTTDAWHIVNQLADSQLRVEPGDPAELDLNRVVLHLSALNGVLGENMTHDSGWQFVGLGRRLERVIYSARLMHEVLESGLTPGPTQLELLLEIFDAVLAYRRKYAALQRETVLDLLLCDESHPRALAAQLEGVRRHLLDLPGETTGPSHSHDETLALRVLSEVRLLDARQPDPAVLLRVEHTMLELSGRVGRRYFMHLRTASVGRDVAVSPLPDSV